MISNINQMEHLEGEKYSQKRNPRAYMSIRDYRSLPWQNQQPLGRNPNPNRSMRDYRDQWMSAPVYSVPSTYTPPTYPHFASSPQPQQPPTSSPIEQAILTLSKLVDNFIEEQSKDSPLPATSSQNPVYILPAAQFTPEAPAPKAESIPSALPVQYSKNLVAFVQTFATTSKKMAAADVAWHSGWFRCWFGFRAPKPRHC